MCTIMMHLQGSDITVVSAIPPHNALLCDNILTDTYHSCITWDWLQHPNWTNSPVTALYSWHRHDTAPQQAVQKQLLHTVNLSIKYTPNKGCPSDEDTACSPKHI